MITTIIFDAEGVVIDTEHLWDIAQQAFLEKRGIVYRREQIKHFLTGKSLNEGTSFLKNKFKLKGSVEKLSQERLFLISDLMKKKVSFVKGFLPFFITAKKNYKVCIATSLQDNMLSIVRKSLKLDLLFSKRLYSVSQVNNIGKPEPDLFLYAAAHMKVSPSSCAVIEDSPHGIEAAKRAGMYAIGITTTYPKNRLSKANLVVDSFSQIHLSKISRK